MTTTTTATIAVTTTATAVATTTTTTAVATTAKNSRYNKTTTAVTLDLFQVCFGPMQDNNFNKLGKNLLGDNSYQVSRL